MKTASVLLALAGLSMVGAAPARRIPDIVWEPEIVIDAPECVRSLWEAPRSSMCVVTSAPDGAGGLHLFQSMRPLGGRDAVRRDIEHYLLSHGGVRKLAPIPTEHTGVEALEAAASRSGEVDLVWAEQEWWDPAYHRPEIFLRHSAQEAWGPTRAVLDDLALPFVLTGEDLAVLVNPDDSVDVFWKDLREDHSSLIDIFGCARGGYGKTYRRRLTANETANAQQIQRKGRFDAERFAPGSSVQGSIDLFWADNHAGVKLSTFDTDRWTSGETVAQCRTKSGSAFVSSLEAAPGDRNVRQVAWICSNEERGKGTTRTQHFLDLFISTQVDGRWQTGLPLSRQAATVRWLTTGEDGGLFLVQETNHTLSLRKLEGSTWVDSLVISERTVEGILEAGMEASAVHIVYAEKVSDTEVLIKYRRGVLARSAIAGDQP